MNDATDRDLSFYCKAYRFADIKRFREFGDDLLVDGSARGLTDEDIVFVHPNYCVTRSVFLPRLIARMPSAEWIEFCKRELGFEIPADVAAAADATGSSST